MDPIEDASEQIRSIMTESFMSVSDSLSGESDRGSIVLGTAWLDESLTRVLLKYLTPQNKSTDDLFSPGKPIGDFGTKIMLSNRLGLITDKMAISLRICKKLRNDFAHIASDLSFETQEVKDRIRQLLHENFETLNLMGEELRRQGYIFNLKEEDTLTLSHLISTIGAKHLFCLTCGTLYSALNLIERGLKQSTPQFSLS